MRSRAQYTLMSPVIFASIVQTSPPLDFYPCRPGNVKNFITVYIYIHNFIDAKSIELLNKNLWKLLDLRACFSEKIQSTEKNEGKPFTNKIWGHLRTSRGWLLLWLVWRFLFRVWTYPIPCALIQSLYIAPYGWSKVLPPMHMLMSRICIIQA